MSSPFLRLYNKLPACGSAWKIALRSVEKMGTATKASIRRSQIPARFQRGKRERRRVWEVRLAPRSGYVLSGEARRSWEHSIPPSDERRYSVTFRTLRDR